MEEIKKEETDGRIIQRDLNIGPKRALNRSAQLNNQRDGDVLETETKMHRR